MPNNIYFGRETKVILQQGIYQWEIPILNGFNFSQSANISEVMLAEMSNNAGVSRRGSASFTDSQAPAEWSFETYIRPTIASSKSVSPEDALWANFIAANAWTGTAWAANTLTSTATTATGEFTNSNKVSLGEFTLWFITGAVNSTTTGTTQYSNTGTATATLSVGHSIMKIAKCVVNEVSINYDIDGIATLSWSGFGSTLTAETSTGVFPSVPIKSGINNTNNFVRNRVTQMDLFSRATPGGAAVTTYSALTLTGGSLTISNNITYLTPEVLGVVNRPIGHVTGGRSVKGSFTTYLDLTNDSSEELFTELTSGASNGLRNYYDIKLYIGGKNTASPLLPTAPGLAIAMPNCHLSIPTFDNGDIVSLSVDFTAVPTDMGATDEISSFVYAGIA